MAIYDDSIGYRLKQIGLNVAYYRKLKNMNQDNLANKAQMERSAIGHLESTKYYSNPISETLLRIADALEINPGLLLEFRNDSK